MGWYASVSQSEKRWDLWKKREALSVLGFLDIEEGSHLLPFAPLDPRLQASPHFLQLKHPATPTVSVPLPVSSRWPTVCPPPGSWAKRIGDIHIRHQGEGGQEGRKHAKGVLHNAKLVYLTRSRMIRACPRPRPGPLPSAFLLEFPAAPVQSCRASSPLRGRRLPQPLYRTP